MTNLLDRSAAASSAQTLLQLNTRANPLVTAPEHGAGVIIFKTTPPPPVTLPPSRTGLRNKYTAQSLVLQEQDRKPASELEQHDPERFDGMS